MLMSRSQKTGQKYTIRIANRSFEDVAKFICLGTTLRDQNHMHEEIKSRLNSGNACYHSVQSLLSSRLLSRNLKVKIYKTIILPVVLYGCETWSLTLREECRLTVFENRVLRRICGPKRAEVMTVFSLLGMQHVNFQDHIRQRHLCFSKAVSFSCNTSLQKDTDLE
jgi:hypothetical protein